MEECFLLSERRAPPVYGLLKFGKKCHLEQLRQDGLLHMKPLSYFTAIESDAVRGDPFEGTDQIIQPKHIGRWTLNHPVVGAFEVDPSELSGPMRFSGDKTSLCNVYCMFAITQPVEGRLVDTRNVGFGDSFVLILNTKEFLERVTLAAQRAGFSGQCRLVDYFDEDDYSGRVGRFKKRSVFSYQNEFRIAIEPGSEEPVNLRVGSLQDITSEALPSSEVSSLSISVK